MLKIRFVLYCLCSFDPTNKNINIMTLTTVLQATPTKELVRASKSNKGYFFFDISVFNVGVMVSIKCTDNYKEPNYNTWNGYDFIIENDSTTNYYIIQELKNR